MVCLVMFDTHIILSLLKPFLKHLLFLYDENFENSALFRSVQRCY